MDSQPRPEWSDDSEQALYDWLGVPVEIVETLKPYRANAQISELIWLYEGIHAVAVAGGKWGHRGSHTFATTTDLFELHYEALDRESHRQQGIGTDEPTLKPATGEALTALQALGLGDGW